jgi:hypothetical protein
VRQPTATAAYALTQIRKITRIARHFTSKLANADAAFRHHPAQVLAELVHSVTPIASVATSVSSHR